MQAGAARVGADAQLGTALHQPVERLAVSGAHVDGGEHAQGASGVEVGAQLVLKQPQAAPLDEGAEQIDTISRGTFRLQGQAHTGLAGGIDQQGAIGQGDQGPGQRGFVGQKGRGPQLLQQPGAGVELVASVDGVGGLLLEQGHDPVHQGQLLLLTLRLRQRGQGGFAQLAKVAGKALGGFSGVEGLELVQGVLAASQGLMNCSAEGVVV